MTRGSRVWWLYYGVETAIFAIALGVFLGVRVLVKAACGMDINNAPFILLMIAFHLTKWRAESVAKAACRKAGLWQEAPREAPQTVMNKRSLERVEPDRAPVAVPEPLDLRPYSRRICGKMAWITTGLSVLTIVISAYSWLLRDWNTFTTSILFALLFLWLAYISWYEECRTIVEVGERGLRRKYCKGIVPWASITGGEISGGRSSSGAVLTEALRLEGAREYKICNVQINNLPPNIRNNLFAWLEARAGLREPEASA